ncbi:MAG TPA: hypothetical protein VLF89_00900 [Candidatus Saccharimonadales bacterium]|nr:hypothetical protein [Candidatus Saccharimonadales bacterium]
MNENSSVSTKSPFLSKIFIILLIIFGFFTTFTSGYFVSHLLSSEQTKPPVSTTASPTYSNPVFSEDSTKFLPGKLYFEDTIMLITKDIPHIVLVATVTRSQQDIDYYQNTRISYYDGNMWTRQSDTKVSSDSAIVANSLIKNWKVEIDPSRVLKQSVQGTTKVNNTDLGFSTNVLQNEISIRSLPGYTKFMSNGNGMLTVNGKTHQAYILYTRIYSLNASDIQFYSQPFGVKTDWIAFWDTQGNFYHIDATQVDNPTRIYQTHKIGVMEDAYGSVSKTFELAIKRDSKNPPVIYDVTMDNPVGVVLHFNRVNSLNKSPNNSFIWYLGLIEGTAQKLNGKDIPGVGLAEYIFD